MQYRVIDLETGEDITDYESFYLDPDGETFINNHDYGSGSDWIEPYTKSHTLEFAFAKDSEGNWIYSHSVVRDNF